MVGDVRIETVGFDEIAKRYTSGAAKLRRVLPKEMGTATLMVSRDAKLAAPVDTGLLRSSILPEVQVIGFDVIGIVGSEVKYAWFQEAGTVKMEGRHYLQRGVEVNLDKITAMMGNIVVEVIGGRTA